MNARNHHLCMRLKYMRKVHTAVEDLRSTISVTDMVYVTAEVGGLSPPLSVILNNITQVLFCTEGSTLLSVLDLLISVIKCTYVN